VRTPKNLEDSAHPSNPRPSETPSSYEEGLIMNLTSKKLGALVATALLSIVGVGAISAPARAADCPYAVADQSDNDHPKDTIRLISPVLTDDNSIHRYDFESQFTVDCDWFGVGMHFNQVYVPFGLRTSLTYHAANAAGAPLANTVVTLRANKGYSNSNAAVRVNGIKARPAPANASDGANVQATTDVNGNVTFVVSSPDDCTTYGGKLPDAPLHLDSDTPNDKNADPTTDCYSQLLPSITGEKTDTADFVELHYFDSSALTYNATEVSLALLAPTLDGTNAISGNGVVQTYSPLASKQIIAFQATKENGSYARNQAVSVRINLANSGANAKISAGIVGNSALGSATTLSNVDSTKTTQDQLVLTGTTDAFGVVTFTLNNSDLNGEAQPATRTSPVPVSGGTFAKVFAELTGVTTMGNAVEFHYYKPALPITVSATAAGKKISVTIKNAIGKRFTVTVTGLKKVTVKPTKATQVYTYTVTKGSKTVTVSADGRTLTKKFLIK